MMEKRATIFGFFLLMNIQGANCFARQLDSNRAQEPQCRSQFDYEYKVVQKIVALENICGDLKTENSELRTEVNELRAEIKTATNELQTESQTTMNKFKEEIQTAINQLKVECQTTTNEIQDLKSKTAGIFACLFELMFNVAFNSYYHAGTLLPFYVIFTQNYDVMTSNKCVKY